MIIPYISKKEPNFQEIEKILIPSNQINHWSNNGPIKTELEQYLNKYLELDDNKCTVCVSNATAGLHLLMMYYEYMSNKELKWAIPSFTFPSPVVGNPKNVVLFDIDLDNYTIPLDSTIEDFDGYILTNLFGTYPENISNWIKYCQEYNKILIFDNASSPLSKINDVNICNFGDSCIISFHPTKYLGAQCEAGAIVMDKDKYDIINSLTNFGFNNSRKYNKYSSNFKLDEIRSAFLLNHLKNYDIDKHIYNQNCLVNEIDKIKNVKLFNYKDGVVYGNLPVLFENNISPNDFRDIGIEVNRYYYPLEETHEKSWLLYNSIINFPLYSNLSEFQLDFIIKAIYNKSK